MRAEQPQKMFNVAAKRVSIAAHENLTPLFSFFFLFTVNICDSSLVDFLVLCSTAISAIFWMFQLFFLVECEWFENCSGIS